jgi:hypothetical protein
MPQARTAARRTALVMASEMRIPRALPCWYFKGMRHAKRLPPGPAGLPLVGSLRAMSRDPLAFLLDLGSGYGDVAYATVGPTRSYALNHPALIEQALVGRYSDCSKDWGTRELAALAGRGLLTSEGEL